MAAELLHIGRVADLVGLSLRTIRYYEEVGLVRPSGRTAGGFRLYDRAAVDRLLLIKRMKPLGYPLEEMAGVLARIDALTGQDDTALSAPEARRQLQAISEQVQDRLAELRAKVAYAEEFRDRLLAVLDADQPRG